MKLITKLLSLAALAGLSATVASAQINLAKTTVINPLSSTAAGIYTATSTASDTTAIDFQSFSNTAATTSIFISGAANTTVWTTYSFTVDYTTTVVASNETTNAIIGSVTADLVYTYTLTKTGNTFSISAALTGSSYTVVATAATASTSGTNTLGYLDTTTGNQYYLTIGSPTLSSITYAGLDTRSTTTVNDNITSNLTSGAVPEPSTYALMGASGLMALVGVRRIRSNKKAA